MPKLKFVDFRAVKQSVSILQILDHYGITERFKRSKNGDSLSGPCPLHNGENPTQFRISVSKNCWHCFSECGHGGNILDFVSIREDCTIREAAVRISEWFNLSTGEQTEMAHEQSAPAVTTSRTRWSISSAKAWPVFSKSLFRSMIYRISCTIAWRRLNRLRQELNREEINAKTQEDQEKRRVW